MRGLEGRAEAVAGTFTAQGVANTRRAKAKMGRAPGAGAMRGLLPAPRAEAAAGRFNAQDVADTLWAYAMPSLFLFLPLLFFLLGGEVTLILGT